MHVARPAQIVARLTLMDLLVFMGHIQCAVRPSDYLGHTMLYALHSCEAVKNILTVASQFYLASNKHPTACNFEGTGKRQLNPGSKGECQGLLEEANKGLSITSPSSKDVRGIATSVSLQAHLYVASLMFFFYPLLPALLSILLFDL